MRRRTFRRLVAISQAVALLGLGLAAVWNLGSLLFDLPHPGWWAACLPQVGLLAWGGVLLAPHMLAALEPPQPETYRLVYDAPPGWADDQARKALRTLARSAGGLTLVVAREGTGTAWWLAVPDGWGGVLRRLVGDVFPGGGLEAEETPAPGQGVVILRPGKDLPAPAQLCRLDGVAGVLYRLRDERTATLALWGAGAEGAARRLAAAGDLLVAAGEGLRRPPFVGENPWPGMPPFPSSRDDPGLAAVSRLELTDPALRVSGRAALVLGRDSAGEEIGFRLPDLAGMEALSVIGRAAEGVVVTLVSRALDLDLPTLVLDGRGTAAAQLARRLLRHMALGQVLLCDAERPAQARFRLNPLWLPEDAATWPDVLGHWLAWLRELGVTPAGLGQAAYRHTQVAVVLSALLAAAEGQATDPPGLWAALQGIEFLPLIEGAHLPCDPRSLLGGEVWDWWLAEGRAVPNFDVQLRLGHLRERLGRLLALPEYDLLWRAPYLDPLSVLGKGVLGLVWRLPDSRRLAPYLSSQLLALTTLLAAWPQEQPLLLVFNELDPGPWAERLAAFPAARLVLAGQQVGERERPAPSARLASCLDRGGAERLAPLLGVRAADLRRLPAGRLVLQRGQHITTFTLEE